ncbi:MAG: peptidase S8 and S53 subtilisin kexin sedolisin [uncultured Thermomicrobiales bacterium]|uniref:Peptidase S8 and S53 subtilisin kexin sedolisin n=1 Tax=uncultured Thermomicrobiales bacterium TaxID=1645740 RepID=A0A6J4TUR0_9BACT|nr:MAG: peptidase S8 and S53 subtilisin kexin sedolisin [uncultured Thermomicrobiales bacterium]
MSQLRPAWSAAFAAGAVQPVIPVSGLDDVTRDWAWGGSTGAGVKVAIIDSGIDADHPAVGGVQGYVAIDGPPEALNYVAAPHRDSYGHGTACAGIVRGLAPDCAIYSVKVLGAGLTGRGIHFAAGLRWAIDNRMDVCNLSLGSTKQEFFGVLHELADLAYFRHIPLVVAANNLPAPSFPSTYAAVVSVAAHDEPDPERYYYNPAPPVEFGAHGIDVQVAWQNGAFITTTGNSFATPHITGIAARILAKHPGLTVFQLKTVLRALAANVGAQDR